MKTLVIYHSICHGNTEKVAKAIAEALSAQLVSADQVTPETYAEYGLVGFGSGIFFGKHHKALLGLVDRLPKASEKSVFVFSTGGMGTEAPNEFLKKALAAKGCKVVGSFACKGYDTYGPFKLVGGIAKGHPDEADLKAAEAFAKTLLKK